MALGFTATGADDVAAAPNDDGSLLVLKVAVGSKVTFTLDSGDKTMASPVITREGDGQSIGELAIADDKKTATATYTVTEGLGRFVAKADVDGTLEAAEKKVELLKPDAAPPAQPEVEKNKQQSQVDEDRPSEINIGEMDPTFAYVTLGFVLVVTIIVSAATFLVISRVDFAAPNATLPKDQILVGGTFGERAAFVVLAIGASVGAITLALGAWLAALETRGRLRIPVKVAATKGGGAERGLDPGALAGVLDKAGDVIDKVRRLRGSMAVVLAGFAVLALALWMIAGLGGARPVVDPSPSPSTSSEPARSPSPEPSLATPATPGPGG